MTTEIYSLHDIMSKAWASFLAHIPALILALIVMVVGLFLIRYISKLIRNLIARYSKDSLITDFLANLISFVLTLLLVVIALSILGWGDLTDKILAGAGITTFIVGFALKDIGENFLAGIIMAFKKPFKTGDLIEIDKYQGTIINMSLRETRMKSLDGKDIFIPNAMILKTPIQNYTRDHLLKASFSVGLHHDDDIEAAIQLIENVLQNFDPIEKNPPVTVIIDSINSNTVNLNVGFWFRTDDISAPGTKLRGKAMLKVHKTLVEKEFHIA